MLKLLLDEHIAASGATGLRRRARTLKVYGMAEWEDGAFLGQDDSTCLCAAARQGLTLVTYDRRTIPPLLKIWAEAGRNRGGVIFIDEKTISPTEVGGLVRALADLAKEADDQDWTNRVVFLRR
ncbi:MAG: hypothetical protein WCC95_02300 [Candidatus Sulfotelmatobacter sp.]|jgi:hypothetical protein